MRMISGKGPRCRAIVYVHSAKGEGGIEVVRTLNHIRVKVVEYDPNHIVLGH